MQINVNIKNNLTKDEIELFDILCQVAQKYSPSTVLRVAGGWVRDRLLDVKSNDIDIMVDNISGEKFANLVSSYIGGKSPHTIKSNPEKSKNIETAKAYITLSSGSVQEVDFAMARKEIYNNNSRIPEITLGSAAEDSRRRDLTINSLFYNLITKEVEDLTGLGIKDLITNTFRTPNDPLTTFKDDPLRIFRVIRFAAKYNGQIEPNTLKAMQHPDIINEIKSKVAKERIGQEFLKILKNPNSTMALHLIKNLGLLGEIISESLKGTKFEGKLKNLDMDQNNPHHELNLWEHTFQVIHNTLNLYPNADPEKKAIMTLAALTHDLGKLYENSQQHSPSKEKYPSHPNEFYTSYHGHEDSSSEIATHILKYLKLDPYVHQVSTLAQYHMRPHSLDQNSSKSLRKFIRELAEKSIQWLDSFNLALADASSKNKEINPATIEKYRQLEQSLINAHSSMNLVENKSSPILNGHEIMNLLNLKSGPKLKEITNFLKDLQDESPQISKEQASLLLKNKFPPLP